MQQAFKLHIFEVLEYSCFLLRNPSSGAKGHVIIKIACYETLTFIAVFTTADH